MAGQIIGFRKVEQDIEDFERCVWTVPDGTGSLEKLRESKGLRDMLDAARQAYLGASKARTARWNGQSSEPDT
jgi:hypothetical protein